MDESPAHSWTFFRNAGFDQVSLSTAADITHLPELDLKLWAVLSCPVKGLEFDERTLALLDGDKDGHIRAQEMITAITFACTHLTDPGCLKAGAAELQLAAISTAKPSGLAIRRCAEGLLATLDRHSHATISLEVVDLARDGYNKRPFNGDGVITVASAAGDAIAAQAIQDIIANHGSRPDRSFEPGIDAVILEAFLHDAKEFDAWWRESDGDPAIHPLGEGTLAGLALLDAVADKVDDFFIRCRTSAFDGRGEDALNRSLEDLQTIGKETLSAASPALRSFPLSHVQAGAALPLAGGINPGWSELIASLKSQVLVPLLGERTHLAEAEWAAVRARFEPTRAWLAVKRGASVEKLGLARIRALIDPAIRTALDGLLARDLAFAEEYDALLPVEMLIRVHRDLYRLLHNFVNFSDFYARDRLANFQAGTLFLDGRSCELVIRVVDTERHAAFADAAKMYLAYCDCTRVSGEKLTIVAAFTAGESDNLLVGRNGVFYDRQGRDWDATIIKVIENPISIRQAFFAPYKRVAKFIEDFITKREAGRDDAAVANLSSRISEAATSPGTAAQAIPKRLDLTLITGLGVVMAGVATAVSGFVSAILGLGVWMPIGFAGILLAISTPSMIIAALKLRQRSLGPLLDANGWAVNGRVKISIPFGSSLTKLARLPKHAKRSLVDPYAERTPWALYTIALVLVALAGSQAWYRIDHHHWWWQPEPTKPTSPPSGDATPPDKTAIQANAPTTTQTTSATASSIKP